MDRPAILVTVALLVIGPIEPLRAQQGPDMTPIPDLGTKEQVIGGEPATRSEWPVTLLFKSATGLLCTSNVVGEKAVITAAHCVGDSSPASAVLRNTDVALTCHHHERYRGAVCSDLGEAEDIVGCTADVALCVSQEPIRSDAGRFERIRKAPPAVASGQRIVILGHGCTTPDGTISPDLNVGEPLVGSTSSPDVSARDPKRTYEEFIKTVDQVVACKGDSGGSAFSSRDFSSREIVGIISRGNMSTDTFLVNVTDPHVRAFLDKMREKHKVDICGLDETAKNCRGS